VYDNPEEARLGLDGHPQNAYHGYWPEQNRVVEPRLGGEDALRAVVAAAHARGISVILDVVPNHVYEGNALFTGRKSDAGFNLPGCVCGTPNCGWGDHILTCWFADYLPDVRYEDRASMRRAVDDVLFWTDGFDLDGVRIDAVPMMPRATTRRIALGLREATFPRESTFVLGEVFTGPGVASLGELRSHIGPNGLDSVFDFPGMWAVRAAVTGQGGFDALEEILATEETSFAGSGVVLTRQVDNHDVTRLVSEAFGDASADPWATPPQQPPTSEPYDRLELGLAASFALPGLPLLWQGDEIGLAGGHDPDSRRVMPSDAELLPRQSALRDDVGRLAALRACSTALRRGDRRMLTVDARRYAFVRGATSDAPVLVALSAETAQGTISLSTGSLAGRTLVDAMTGETFSVPTSGALDLPMKPLSYRFLLDAADPCLASLAP
jgi:glycosidase